MKYFTKYIPVEGEIKEGDRFLCPEVTPQGEPPIYPQAPTCPKCKKVKLFLCSNTTNSWGKPIGEISPDALSYIKEGDTFDETKVQFREKNKDYHNGLKFIDIPPNDYFQCIVKIQGPCGHFH